MRSAVPATLCFLLLINSNVALNINTDSISSGSINAVKKQADMRAKFIAEVEELKGEAHISEAELSKLKQSTFDPVSDVVQRAHEQSKAMHIDDAISKVGQRLSGEMQDLMVAHG